VVSSDNISLDFEDFPDISWDGLKGESFDRELCFRYFDEFLAEESFVLKEEYIRNIISFGDGVVGIILGIQMRLSKVAWKTSLGENLEN
jgi:hypothetical protein